MRWLFTGLMVMFLYFVGAQVYAEETSFFDSDVPATIWERYPYLFKTKWEDWANSSLDDETLEPILDNQNKVYLNPKDVYVYPGHIVVVIEKKVLTLKLLYIDSHGLYVMNSELISAIDDLWTVK